MIKKMKSSKKILAKAKSSFNSSAQNINLLSSSLEAYNPVQKIFATFEGRKKLAHGGLSVSLESLDPFAKIFATIEAINNRNNQVNLPIYEGRKLLVGGFQEVGPTKLFRKGVRDDKGNTILHAIVLKDSPDLLLWLLTRYPDVATLKRVKNREGETPATLAESLGYHDAVLILREAESEKFVEERGNEFVFQFVNRFCTKLQKYEKRVIEESSSDAKAKKDMTKKILPVLVTAGKVLLHAHPIGVGGLGAVTAIHGVYERVQGIKVKKATKTKELFDDVLSNSEEDLARLAFFKILVQTGYEIFSCFEQYFMESVAFTEWRERFGHLAHQCVDRILNYINENFSEENEPLNTTEMGDFCKYFFLGRPNGAAGSSLVIQDTWKEIILKSGVVKFSSNHNQPEYLINVNCNSDKYGFRKLFRFELERMEMQNELKIETPWNALNFAMNEGRIEAGVQSILEQILDGGTPKKLSSAESMLSVNSRTSSLDTDIEKSTTAVDDLVNHISCENEDAH